MKNLQLLLSIGIPSLLIALFWLSSNSQMDRLEKRLDDHSGKLDVAKETSHRDALENMRNMMALNERVAIVETKQIR